MRRPAIPAEYRAALVALARSYADLLLPTERRALWSMYGLPALRAVDRLRLSVLASAARDRNEGRDDE